VAGKICQRVTLEMMLDDKMELLSLNINSHGTHPNDNLLCDIVRKNFSMKYDDMVKTVTPTKASLKRTAVFGHFSRPEFPWEMPKLNLIIPQ
jgi:S-adenosylmethionine synthetase